jgi:hypothetical protein
MKPHEPKNRDKTKAKKKGETKGDKKSNQKRRKDNKTLSQKKRKGAVLNYSVLMLNSVSHLVFVLFNIEDLLKTQNEVLLLLDKVCTNFCW